MSQHVRKVKLVDDLAARSDDELIRLLALRPDLAAPPPRGTAVVAERAQSQQSMAWAGGQLDLLAAAVLEVVSTGTAKSADDVVATLSDRADVAEIEARLTFLADRALIWGPRNRLETCGHARASLPWQGRHLTSPAAARTPEELRAEIAQLSDSQRALLETLSTGSSLGRTRDAAPGADPALPVPAMIAAGMLVRIDDQTVEIAPTVRQILRDEPDLRLDDLRPPPLTPLDTARRFTPADVDAAGGGEALELIRHCVLVLHTLGQSPAAVLRSGALGIRELRRLAKSTGLSVTRLGLVTELLNYLRFIAAGYPDPPPTVGADDSAWAPTHAADGWMRQNNDRQWNALLGAWLAMPRRPWMIGKPDRDGAVLPALASELYDVRAAELRHLILGALLAAPPGVGVEVDALTSYLLWRHPGRQRQLTRALVSEHLREATELGLVAHGALTSVGRAALADGASGSDEHNAAIYSAIDVSLPKPVDHFVTQADLTLMVPGPMTHELADEVEAVADLESAGAASVYRVTEDSVRRALDTGRTAAELVGLFTNHSTTPVPQALTYLIDDVARRHGSLRVGVASAFVRCEDPTQLTAVLRSPVAEALALRALAPTVAVSGASVREVIDRLRAAGFAPAGEDSAGALVDLRPQGSRIHDTRSTRYPDPRYRDVRLHAPNRDQLEQIVSRIRSADRAAAEPKSAGHARAKGGGESAVALIQLALRTGATMRIDYVDAHGSASHHVVLPRLLGAGKLIAVDPATDAEEHFSLHRVTGVELLGS